MLPADRPLPIPAAGLEVGVAASYSCLVAIKLCPKCKRPFMAASNACPNCPETYTWDQESCANLGCLLLMLSPLLLMVLFWLFLFLGFLFR